ncbi:hypothetical protein PBY51_013837 [Eleginops maclovinus]|uniref:Ig-like domain-containing protein n=1 Tax=Eleginops maclovinus TaxID=56733 RepID=A0AAN8AS66_ELEMC|nr:hypothetical protein PBY51_013837 [Eleginops maclovinus]
MQGVEASWCSVVLLLVSLPRPMQASPCLPQDSPPACLCASDILSCTDAGLIRLPAEMPVSTVTLDLSHNWLQQLDGGGFEGLYRLETLRLSHNQLSTVQPGAFRNTSLLRHLDLSSNQLRTLELHYFLDVPALEELLLFDNRIVQVENRALAGLGGLRKVYLSHNRLTNFPFFSLHSQPNLTTLDLSSNRLNRLPLQEVSDLPEPLQRGLYLHNNSLMCECSMLRLFRLWDQMGFPSVTDFKQNHSCLLFVIPKAHARFFQHDRYFGECDMALRQQKGNVSVRVGERLLLHCVTSLTGRNLTFHWLSPRQEYVTPPGNNGSLRMFPNGSLEISEARSNDSGIYLCLSLELEQRRNESQEVNVTVLPLHDELPEPFNTGFTTLLGCVVSLVLVLMYLYLTPCRCPHCLRGPPTPATATPSQGNEARAGSAQSSILTPTPPATTEGPGRKVSTNKHVVFLEPIREQQNGRLRAAPGGHLGPGLLLGAEQQTKNQPREADSVVSMVPDTPVVLP